MSVWLGIGYLSDDHDTYCKIHNLRSTYYTLTTDSEVKLKLISVVKDIYKSINIQCVIDTLDINLLEQLRRRMPERQIVVIPNPWLSMNNVA